MRTVGRGYVGAAGWRSVKGGRLAAAGIAVAIAGMFVVTGAPPVGASGAQAEGAGQFTFPYAYGTPAVPATIGAQGTQGPTVPLSQIGPTTPYAGLGATRHLGPVNQSSAWIWPTAKTAVSFSVLNGTPTSHSAASKATVTLENVTFGTTTTALTSATGAASLSVVPGWYLVTISGRAYTNLNYEQLLNIPAGNPSLTKYLIPATDGTTTVHNCGTGGSSCTATLYLTQQEPWGQNLYEPQRQVELLNHSSGDALLSTTYTLSNGTAIFTQVSTLYTYEMQFIGYNSSATNQLYYESNVSSNSFSATTGANHVSDSNFVSGHSYTTGSLTGTAMVAYQSNANWNIATATVITGGVTYISMGMNFADPLTIVNGMVFFNTSRGYQGGSPKITLINSTAVVLTDSQQPICPTGVGCLSLRNGDLLGMSAAAPGYFNGIEIGVLNATSSVFEYLDQQNYGYTHGAFFDSMFTSCSSVNLGDSAVPARSTYINETTLDNSTIGGGPVPSGSNLFYAAGVRSNNTTFDPSTTSLTVSNSWLEVAPPGTNAYGFQTTWGNFTHVRIQLVPEYNVSFTAVYNSYSVLQTGKGQAVAFYLPAHTNLSYVYVNQSFPSLNLSMEESAPSIVNVYDSVINVNYTVAQLAPLPTSKVTKAGIFYIEVGINSNAPKFFNYSELNIATLGQFDARNITFNHDSFPYFVWSNPFEPFQWNYPAHGKSWVSFYNTTFGDYYYDASALFPVVKYEYGEAGSDYLQNTNYPTPKLAWFNVSHDTFQARMMGGGQAQASADIFSGERNVYATISASRFDNSFIHTLGASRMLANPYNYDVMASGGSANITGNYFLNLTNQTMPVGSNAGVTATTEGGSRIALTANHYYFAPMPGQSQIPAAGPFQITQGPSTPTDANTGVQLISTIAYEIPMTPNGTITVASPAQLVFNTSVLQTDPASGDLTNHAYSWGIAPDVSVASGEPVISYTTGLAGGPQPNFKWHGYNYTESVESSYIQVGVNSSNAPPVVLSFSPAWVAGSQEYAINEYDSVTGSLLAASDVYASSTGVLTQTYNPATMPLDPIFAVANISSTGASGCIVNCTTSGTSNPGLTLGISLQWNVIAGILLLVAAVAVVFAAKRAWIAGAGLAVVGIVLLVVF